MPPGMEENPGSFLATISPLEQDLELSQRDQDAAQTVSDGLRDAKSPHTRRAYASAWKAFCEWTVLTDRQSMPAEPQTAVLYLGHLAARLGRLSPPQIWPGPPYHMPMPGQGYPRLKIPPAIRSWPKRSRDGGTHLQRPHRWTRSPPWPWHGSGKPPAYQDAAAVVAPRQPPRRRHGAPST